MHHGVGSAEYKELMEQFSSFFYSKERARVKKQPAVKKQPKAISEFEASFNPSKQCISIDGDGASIIKFVAPANQLACVLRSLADLKDKTFQIKIYALDRNLKNGKNIPNEKGIQVYR